MAPAALCSAQESLRVGAISLSPASGFMCGPSSDSLPPAQISRPRNGSSLSPLQPSNLPYQSLPPLPPPFPPHPSPAAGALPLHIPKKEIN